MTDRIKELTKLTNVLIIINPNVEKRQIQFKLNGTWWYAELTSENISIPIIG